MLALKNNNIIICFIITLLISCQTPNEQHINENRNLNHKAINTSEKQKSKVVKQKFDKAKLVGTWEDENSTIEYFESGAWVGYWDRGELSGNWKLRNDLFTMSFILNSGKPVDYKILTLNDSLFVIKSIADGVVFRKVVVR